MVDKRRPDLVKPYHHVPDKTANEQSTAMFTSTLPLAAMFLRNKLIAWAALFTAVQGFLNEPTIQSSSPESQGQPAWITLTTALIGMITCYMDFAVPSMRPLAKQATDAAAAAATGASS